MPVGLFVAGLGVILASLAVYAANLPPSTAQFQLHKNTSTLPHPACPERWEYRRMNIDVPVRRQHQILPMLTELQGSEGPTIHDATRDEDYVHCRLKESSHNRLQTYVDPPDQAGQTSDVSTKLAA